MIPSSVSQAMPAHRAEHGRTPSDHTGCDGQVGRTLEAPYRLLHPASVRPACGVTRTPECSDTRVDGGDPDGASSGRSRGVHCGQDGRCLGVFGYGDPRKAISERGNSRKPVDASW